MTARTIIGAIIILIGLGILFDINVFRFLIPAILIFLGLQVLLGKEGKWNREDQKKTNEEELKRVMIFSGMDQKVITDDFKKAEIVAIFGGADLDLSETKTKSTSLNLDLIAIFGGIRIRVPKDWHISSEGVGILGGFDNKAEGKGKVSVKVSGVGIFGGVEIVN